MVSDWEVVELGDVARFYSGGTPQKSNPEYWGGEIPWISAKSMKGNRYYDSDLRLTKAGLDKGSRLAPVDSVLLLVRGSILHQKIPVGIVTKEVAFNQDVKAIVPNEKFLPLFFYYSFAGREQELLAKVENTGIGAGKLDISVLNKVQFYCPPIHEQVLIISFLSSLDDKIELNRQMNETLEAMAQALFKSWFVDFDPVIDNALLAGKAIPEPLKERAELRQAQLDSGKAKTNSEINDLFPSEFEFTEELGWIPKGWSIANFGDLLNSTIGGDWGKPEPDEKHNISSVIIRGTDIPDLKKGDKSAAPNRWVEAKKLKTRKLEPYDIVIEISGGSPTQPTGRSIIINENLLERLGGTVEPASFCRRFTPIDKYVGIYAGIHLQKIYDDGKMWEYQNQSTGIANFQTKSFLEREILILPNQELLVKYYELVNPLLNKMTSNQPIELAKLRDTLLPKLMSGELRIADAEKLAENI